MRFIYALTLLAMPLLAPAQYVPTNDNEWKLVWSDEFDTDGPLNPDVWNFERGFARNHEDQWYQADNAVCKDGKLVIECRKEPEGSIKNPMYEAGSRDWRKQREFIGYTSSSVNTRGKVEFCYGRLEVLAKLPTASGAWPAIWLLGDAYEWPSGGEIDVMEYYQVDGVPHILANACWGNDRRFDAVWNTKRIPFGHFTGKDPDWADKYHLWTMDWDEEKIDIYLDGELLNSISLADTVNGKIGEGSVAFTMPMYVLLNLALGGDHGGDIDDAAMPMRYEIDYARVYEKIKN